MSDSLRDTTKSVSFKCRACKSTAKIVYDDGSIQSVFCSDCGVSVDTEIAREMYLALMRKYTQQESRNLIRGLVGKGGMRRIPLRNTKNEFSDSKWPFILMINDNV